MFFYNWKFTSKIIHGHLDNNRLIIHNFNESLLYSSPLIQSDLLFQILLGNTHRVEFSIPRNVFGGEEIGKFISLKLTLTY